MNRWYTAFEKPCSKDWKMLELAEVGNGVWDEGFGKEGLRPFELATIRLQSLSWDVAKEVRIPSIKGTLKI